MTAREGHPTGKVEATPAPVAERHAGSGARPYEPPRLTEKKALDEVTLFTFGCTPGAPNCNVGRP